MDLDYHAIAAKLHETPQPKMSDLWSTYVERAVIHSLADAIDAVGDDRDKTETEK